MRNKLFFLFSVVCLVTFSCVGKKNIAKEKNSLEEEEYLSLFTDATKQALVYGNYRDAILLYNKCIELFSERAAPYYQLSNIYLSSNDINTGKKYAKKAYELDNSNTWYLLHLANIYQYENNIDSLIFLYEKLVKVSDNPEYKYNLSVFYSQKGDYKNSMKLLSELEKEFTDTKELIMMKHQNYKSLLMSDSAVAQLEILVKVFPDSYENLGLLAEYLSEINRYDYADSVYRKMLKMAPDNGLANISYADYFMRLGKKDSALVYYKVGFTADDIKIEDKIGVIFNLLYDPVLINTDTIIIPALINKLKEKYNDSRTNTIAAEYYVKKQKYTIAASELKTAIDLKSNNYIVWEQYIMINNYLNRHSDVYGIYKDAIEKFSDKIKLFIYSGYSIYELEKYDEVIVICEKGLSIKGIENSDYVQVLNLLADSYRKLENYKKSDSLFEAILLVDPENLAVRNNYSYYLSLRNENLERARELSYFTIKKDSKNPTFLDTYGWILFKMGNAKEAIKYIEAAIKNGAYSNSEVLEHYGDVMFYLKRYTEAKEAWEEALKYNSENENLLNEKILKVSVEENIKLNQ